MKPEELRILLIDDNDITREVLRVVLRGQGYQIVGEAGDGDQGLQMALEQKPDLILLDVMMPQVSGLDILPRIREQLPDTRILLVTGSEDHETLREAARSGIDGFIMKPFRARHITEAVSKVIPGLTSAGDTQ